VSPSDGLEKGGRGRIRELDSKPALVRAAKALRRLLPGDKQYGDPLSLGGSEPSQLIGQRLAAITAERPSALREAGLGALQAWQALSEAQGRGRGDEELAILFTDLVEFSPWALEAGDTMAIDLLRQVAHAVEPPIEKRGGRVVKRLGDGLMAVFHEPAEAVEAAIEGCRALQDVEVGGYRPRLRAGVHVGKPRKMGGDYLGVDVNVAARVAAGAGPEEVLISEATRERLEGEHLSVQRRWRFKAKGAPKDLKVYTADLGG
jgi:adenylate cyclase